MFVVYFGVFTYVVCLRLCVYLSLVWWQSLYLPLFMLVRSGYAVVDLGSMAHGSDAPAHSRVIYILRAFLPWNCSPCFMRFNCLRRFSGRSLKNFLFWVWETRCFHSSLRCPGRRRTHRRDTFATRVWRELHLMSLAEAVLIVDWLSREAREWGAVHTTCLLLTLYVYYLEFTTNQLTVSILRNRELNNL